MINVNGIKRNAKNIVKKYSDAQVKVREATSNDPWGPSSTMMAEIADLTYNVVAFSEIMQMIWKRLNDHGKNWRHVYKALVVLEYLIKTGSEKVAQQCIENIFAIQTLKDFQYMEENKDHGMNIREKSKKLVALLKDSEKLKAERARAIKAKSRLAESMSSVGKGSLGSMMGSSGSSGSGGDTSGSACAGASTSNNNNGSNFPNYQTDSGSTFAGGLHSDKTSLGILSSDIDSARPQTLTEEENQLKLALALSKEEAEQQEKTRKNDELRLKLALDVSKKTASVNPLDDLALPGPSTSTQSSQQSTSNTTSAAASPPAATTSKSTIDDLLGLSIPTPEPQNDPWSSDPWPTIASTQSTTTLTSSTMPTGTLPPSSQSTSTILPKPPTLQSNINLPFPPALNTTPSTLTTNNTMLSMFSPIAPMMPGAVQAPATNVAQNNLFNKRPMSKNPFED